VVHLSTYLFENPYTDVQASDLSDGRTPSGVAVLDRNSGVSSRSDRRGWGRTI